MAVGDKMSCYHPLAAVPTDAINVESGKRSYIITSLLKLPYEFPKSYKDGNFLEIPCGQCTGCRMDYAKKWADRCMLESLYHKHNWFATFTYNKENVPMIYDNINFRTGEIKGSFPDGLMTLRYSDFQKFLKRLRQNRGQFRYYACSEYGGSSMRPHYHCLFFGLDLKGDDLKPYKTIGQYVYYSSPILERIWNKGFVIVSPFSYANAAYTARYVMKKADRHIDYDYLGIERERTYMSRRPGIGYQYYEDHDMYEYDYQTIGDENGSYKIYPSRYFDKLLEMDDPELFEKIKAKRLDNMKNRVEMKLSQNDYDYLEMLEVEEDSLLNRSSALSRNRLDKIPNRKEVKNGETESKNEKGS